MNIYELKNLSPEDRKIVLLGEAIGEAEQGVYMKPLSAEELAEQKDHLAARSIEQAKLLKELDEIKKSFKNRLDPIKSNIAFSVDAIKNQAIQISGLLWKLPDYDNNLVHIVDDMGTVISSRQMMPKERQYNVPFTFKNAANGAD